MMKSKAIYCTLSIFLAFFSVSRKAQDPSLQAEVREALLEKAKQWGVPQPSAESLLYKIKVYQSRDTDYFALGFVEPGKPEQALVGLEYWEGKEMWRTTQRVSNPEAISLENIASSGGGWSLSAYEINYGLVTGIQLLRRGDQKLGSALIEKALKTEAGHHRSPFISPAGEESVLMLARACLAAAINQITTPAPDFRQIKQRVETLLADQPALKSSALDEILESLEASVAHKSSAADSIEKVIDNYLLDSGAEGKILPPGKFSSAERELIVKGFEAVPALLEQRHSKRLTNHLMHGFNNFPSYPMIAGQVINAYLQRLANDEFGSNWLERQKGLTASDEAVLAWWKKASALGEEAYIKKHIVALRTDKQGDYLSPELLLLAQERYPALLPGIYQSVLKTSAPSGPVAEALTEGIAIAGEQKIELLQAAIATNSVAHRNDALRLLRNLDLELADAKLLQLLKKAPSTAKDAYWTDQDASLGWFVSVSSNADVWKAFHALLERADLGMRMELIDHLNPPDDAPAEILTSFYGIYDQFCEDKAVRDQSTSKKFSGPGAAFSHEKIEMRDFLHEHWAHWLKLELKLPSNNVSPLEWQEYRKQVSLAVKQHREDHGLLSGHR